jgi:hypothetical protein
MTYSSVPSWAEKSSSYDYLRQQKSDADAAALASVDDDEEYRKQQESNAAELMKVEAQQSADKSKKAMATAEAATPPNPVQEIGTAVVGAGIDAVEGVGATAEATLTGKMLDPNFKPTWLQVADEKEPMNRTVWGNLLRGVGEYALLYGVLGKAAKGAKVLRVPGANPLSKALASDAAKSTAGKVVREATKGAIKGAAADFVSSYSTGETLSTGLNEMFPMVPDWLVTKENDTPLERKVKNVVEGLGLGAITDVAFAWRAASKAAKEIPVPKEESLKAFQKTEKDLNRVNNLIAQKASTINPDGKLTPDQNAFLRETDAEWNGLLQARSDLNKQYKELHDSISPDAIASVKAKDSADRRQANFNEKVETTLADDPEGLTPNAWVNSPLFDQPDKALFSPAGKGGMYKSLLESYRMENDGILSGGRRPSLYTESALEKRLSQFNPERKKAIEDVAKQLNKELESASSTQAAEGFKKGLDVRQLQVLSTAKYIDIIDELGDSPADIEKLRAMLMDDKATQFDYMSGKNDPYLGLASHRAAEMLINTSAGEISDLAQAGRSIDGVLDNSRQVEAVLNRMKFLLMETGKAKYIKGFALNALKVNPSEFASGLAKRETEVAQYIDGLKNLFQQDPSMIKSYLDIMSLADGNVKALDEMYQFAKDKVFNWNSFIGRDGSKSAFVDALTSIMYNSVLSGPKTIMRAAMGNTLITFTRPVQAIMGGVLAGDQKAAAMGFATLRTSFEAIGEAWTVAKKAWSAGKNNLEDIPYLSTGRLPATMTDQWKNVGAVIDKEGTAADKAMYHLTTTLYDFNNWIGVKYPMTAMNAIDAGTSVIMGRVDAKLQAFSKAWDETGGNVSKELVDKYDNEFRSKIFDHKAQMIKSEYAARVADETGLKLPLEGKIGQLENFISNTPAVRPFFLFMKTGWNALTLVQKHTPILARFNGEVADVLKASADNLDSVSKYGITNPAQLIEAQAVMRGRIATGYMTVGSAIGLYMSGGLTGNGPADREDLNAWIQSGWRPRSIRMGDTWLSYDSLEPFTSFLSMVADIGDNSNSLGQTATENWYRKVGYLIGMNVSNKSFLAGLGPLNEVLSMNPAQSAVWVSNVANNQLPWSGARNELANIFNPGMRELDKDWRKGLQTIANRNPLVKNSLPQKFDILDGSVVREFDPLTRLFNSVSPIQINFKDNDTRRMLRESGYDISFTLASDSNKNKLDAKTRSRLQNLMGQQGIEQKLEKLFNDPNVKAEMATYRKFRDLGIRSATGEDGDKDKGVDVKDSFFYERIDRIFRQAKKAAEVQLYQEYPALRSKAVAREVKQNLQQANKPESAIQFLDNFPHGK